jgi:FKBP-type peptidyl-prolyl cis-trans isomerase 2
MKQVEQNDSVTISFIGKLNNGTIFQTVTQKEPAVITIGSHDIPPTLEQALIGMSAGENKQVRLEPDEGYGIRRKDLLQTLKRSAFNEKMDLRVGMILSLNVEKEGQPHQVPATIIEINEETLVVDYNHPLAGHDLFYDITVMAIERKAA